MLQVAVSSAATKIKKNLLTNIWHYSQPSVHLIWGRRKQLHVSVSHVLPFTLHGGLSVLWAVKASIRSIGRMLGLSTMISLAAGDQWRTEIMTNTISSWLHYSIMIYSKWDRIKHQAAWRIRSLNLIMWLGVISSTYLLQRTLQTKQTLPRKLGRQDALRMQYYPQWYYSQKRISPLPVLQHQI